MTGKWVPLFVAVCCGLLLLAVDSSEGKKSGGKRKEGDEDDDQLRNRFNGQSDRNNGLQGLPDTETSAQAINPSSIQNPLLYQNQLNQQGQLGQLGGNGGLSNLGGGVFSNQAAANNLGGSLYLAGLGGGGYQNPYLGLNGGLGGIGGGLGGFGGYGGFNGLGGYGGLNGIGGYGGFGGLSGLAGYGGVTSDIYNQGAYAAQLYNNPLYGAGAGTLTGAAAGINPLLLRGAQNQQYPVIGGLGNYNPYLAAQALLSPYSNYNQLNNFPFSSRFGVGAGSGRSGLGGRFNSGNSNSRSNNDE